MLFRSPAAAGAIVAALGAEGYDVTAATSGGEGLALALARAFGAITLDRMLPGLDGSCATLHRLKV